MVQPWSTAAVRVLGVAAGRRSEFPVGTYAAGAQKLKHTSSVYGLRSTFLPDSPLIRIYQNRGFSRGREGGKRLNPLLGKRVVGMKTFRKWGEEPNTRPET